MSDIFERFPEMRPVYAAPSLHTINGIGTMAYGDRDRDRETGTYVKTVWLTLLFIPVLPLGAYRVADAPNGGWYFIGKVPLSGLAKGWPLVLLLIIGGVVGFVMWNSHTSSPSYAAEQKLAQAARLRDEGKLAESARLCREVADGKTEHAPKAMKAIRDILDDPALLEKGNAQEMAGVFQVAWDLRQRPGAIPDLPERGLRFAESRAADSPDGSLAVLEAIEPAAKDPKATLPIRQKILERLTQDRPDDVQLLSKLAVVYERGGNRDRCLALLEPHAKSLGTTEGARVLGMIYYEKGKHEEAFTLLQAYADEHLKTLADAESQYVAAIRAIEDGIIAHLRSGKAKDFDYQRHKTSSRPQQDAMVNEYVDRELRDSPELRQRRDGMVRLAAVVPVALDLGSMRLLRAQRMADPAERKAELERAEKTFLSVRGLAGNQAEYRLSLGQVYYWLGKQAEGRKLFDDTLKADGRRYETLMQVAGLLRELGALDEARTLVEEAYRQDGLDQKKRQTAAMIRAVNRKDHDDAILWLERADGSLPAVQAELALARGHKAMAAGKDEEAAGFFRQVIAVYTAQPETSASLNNSGLAYQDLYRATGDKAALQDGRRLLDRAITLKPGDGILVGNVAYNQLSGAAAELAGDRIDFGVLRREPEWGDLQYLYNDPAGRQDIMKRARGQASVTQARSTYDRALILAPNNYALYHQYEKLLYFLGEALALENLGRRAAESSFDEASARQDRLDLWQGKRDARWRPELAAAAARAERRLAEARKSGGATFALAVGVLLQARLGQEMVGVPIDADEMVRLADEAHKAAPSTAAQANLRMALLTRAGKALAAEPAYANMAKRAGRSLGSSYLIAVALWRDGPARQAALANADVRRAVALTRDFATRFPDSPDEWSWVLLRPTHPEDAARVGAAIKANELFARKRALDARLSLRGDPGAALRQCWVLEATGNAEQVREVLRRCVADGGPLPFDVP
jgi:hypothetical protein